MLSGNEQFWSNHTTHAGRSTCGVDHPQRTTAAAYGYKGKLEHILQTEFPHLQSKVYADHAGATLYTKSQIDAYQQVEPLCASLVHHQFAHVACQHNAGCTARDAYTITASSMQAACLQKPHQRLMQ